MKKTNALRILDQQNIPYQVIPYTFDDQKLSVPQIAANNKLPLSQVYKTLVTKGDKTGVIIAVIPGNTQLIFKALAKVSGNKKTTTIAVKDLENLTGYIRGGCSPIGMKKKFPVYIDQTAESLETIYVNAGKKGILIKLNPVDLKTITVGAFADIAEKSI